MDLAPAPSRLQTSPAGDRGRIALSLEAGFGFLSDEYRVLFETSSRDAFRHPLWLDSFYRHLVPARGGTPVLLTGRRSEDGSLVFLAPMVSRSKRGLRLLETAGLGVSDYASVVLEPRARESLAADPELKARIAALCPAHDLLRIQPIRPEALGDWTLLFDAATEELDFGAHEAAPTLPYAAWRNELLTASYRKYLDRRARRLEKSGAVTFERLDGEAARQGVADIRALREGRFAGDMIQAEAVARFYGEVAARGARAGFVRVYRLCLDGEPMGTVFCLTEAGRLLYLLIGCDYERFGRHSPGLILYDRMMEDWAEAGGTIFDFTIGDEPFKLDYGTRRVAMRALVATPTIRGRAGLAAQSLLARGGAAAGAARARLAAKQGGLE